jgi:UDP-glucuronate decarboxylase
MKKILVAGGAGFLGSHLCKNLISNNAQVTCIDNLSTGNMQNISSLLENKNFTFFEHDIIQPIELETKFDQIYNLACPASPEKYQSDPLQTIYSSVIGSKNLLELAKKNESFILQASTSEVYGDPNIHPQKESYWGNVNPIGIRSCYDEGKRLAETLFFDFSRTYGTKIRVVRIFNTYGPYMDPKDGRVVSNFINQAIADENITIYGDGLQTRSFCYVDDMINFFVGVMNSPSNQIGPINVGNSDEFTVKSLAEKVIRLTNSNSKISYLPLPQDDPIMRRPDLSKLNKEHNLKPSVDLETGLIKTIEYFKLLNQ